MRRVTLSCSVFVGLTLTVVEAHAQQRRFWYDSTYRHRTDATIVNLDEKNVGLQKLDGKVITLAKARLSAVDHVYLDAYRLASHAAPLLDASPYVTAGHELQELKSQMVANGVSAEQASHVTRSNNRTKDRKLEDLVGRCVEINGIAYEVIEVRVSNRVTGFDKIVVKIDDRTATTVRPYEIETIKILPSTSSTQPRIVESNEVGNPFRRRGPPRKSPYLPHDRWKYELVYDPVEFVWTDAKSAQAHKLLAHATHLWRDAKYLERYAAARWHVHQGNAVAKLDMYDKALLHFNAAIDNAPGYADAYLQRALVYKTLQRNRDALSDLDEAIRHAQIQMRHGFHRIDVLLPAFEARSTIRSEEKLHDEAIADAESAVQLSSIAAADRYRELLFSVRQTAAIDTARLVQITIDKYRAGTDPGDSAFELAVSSSERAIAYNPDPRNDRFQRLSFECRKLFAPYLADKANSALERKQYSTAALYARKAQRQNPDSNDKQYDRLVVTCDQALIEHKIQVTATYVDDANNAIARKDFGAAIAFAEAAEHAAPDDLRNDVSKFVGRCYFLRGQWHHDRANYKNAITDLTVSIGKNPSVATAHFYRGLSHYALGELPEAVTDLNRATGLEPNADIAFFVRSLIYVRQGQHEKAIADLTTAINLDATESLYWYHRALVHHSIGRSSQAFADVSKAIQWNANEADYYVLRSQIYLGERDFRRASDDVERALRVDPTSLDARQIARRIETRRRFDDPYYFDEDAIFRAAFKVGGAWLGGKAMRSGAEDIADADSLLSWKAAWGTLQLFGGYKGKDWAINSAIDDVLPNFPEGEKVLLASTISQFVDSLVYDDQPTLMAFLGGVGEDVTREGLRRWVNENHPEWTFGAGLADFMYQIHSELKKVKTSVGAMQRPNARVVDRNQGTLRPVLLELTSRRGADLLAMGCAS